MDLPVEGYTNPLVNKIIEECAIGTKMATVRGDLESVLYGLKVDQVFEHLDEKTINIINGLISDIKPSLKTLKHILLSRSSKFVKSYSEDEVTLNLLNNLIDSKTYPIGEKANALYILHLTKSFPEAAVRLNDQLIQDTKRLIERGKIKMALLSSFSIRSDEFLHYHIENLSKAKEKESDLHNLNRQSVAKSLIYCLSNSDEPLQQYVSLFEQLAIQQYSISSSPDLWFAISESEKIINSNLPKETNDELLELIKQRHEKWSDMIRSIGQGYVTINIDNRVGFATRSNYDLFYDFEVLRAAKRDRVLSLPMSEINLYKSYINRSDVSTSHGSILRVVFVTIIITGCISLLLVTNWNSLINLSSEFYESKVNPKSPKDILGYVTNPIVAIFILGWWLINILREVDDVYINSWSKLISLNPVTFYLKKFFSTPKT